MKKNINLLLFAFFIASLFLAVYAFTRHSFIKGFDLRQTGQIGDTIGGISGPIINLLGAILVYLSFREQKKANDDQWKALNTEKDRFNDSDNYNQLIALMDDIQKSINSFHIIGKEIILGEMKGLKAFDVICEYVNIYKTRNISIDKNIHESHKVIDVYINFLKFCLYTIDTIESSKFTNSSVKELLSVKFIMVISPLDSHFANMNHNTNGLVDKELHSIYEYTKEINQKVYAMKNSTTHFKY